jgi:hypothetical protein
MTDMDEDGDEAAFQWFEVDEVGIRDRTSLCQWLGRWIGCGRIKATKVVRGSHLLASLHSKMLGLNRIEGAFS